MDAKELRIVFMGTPDFAVASLRCLVERGYNIVAVVTAPDRAAGRGLKLQQSAVKHYATEAGLKTLQPEKLRDPQFVEEFSALEADLAIVIAFRMLPEIIWSKPRLGTFNLHASLLPQYRGAAPINWAVINGEQKSGVTTFMLNHEIDKGAIIAQREVEIGGEESAGMLHDKLMLLGRELVVETVDKIASGRATQIEQTQGKEGLKEAPKIFKEDCQIDWSKDTESIYNLIRGLSPYPTAWSEMKNSDADETIGMKIYSAHREKAQHDHSPGRVFTDNREWLKVACGEGYIHIEELQVAGKRRMSIADFLRGFKEITNFEFV